MADNLMHKRGAAAAEQAEILNQETVTDEQFQRAEQLDSEIVALDEQIQERRETMKQNAENALAAPTIDVDRTGAIQNRANDSDMAEYVRWFNSGGQVHSRALSTSAGALIPQDLQTELVRALPAVSAFRQCPAIDVRQYSEDVEVAAVAARMTVGAGTEAGTINEDTPTFHKVRYYGDFSSKVRSLFSDEIIRNMRPNAVQETLLEQAEGHALYWEGQYATNAAASQDAGPYGLMVSKAQYVAAGHNATEEPNRNCVETTYVTTDTASRIASIIDATKTNLDARYWGQGNCWIVGQAFYAGLLGLLDGNNRPLFQPSWESSLDSGLMMGRLMGDPVYVTSQAPTASAEGDVLGVYVPRGSYRIADRMPMTTLFDPYSQANTGQVQYVSSMWSDARFTNYGNGVSYLLHS